MYKGNRGYAPHDGAGFAPVKVGEEFDVKIEAVGEKGDGIARKQGFVLFVPNTKQGDEVRIRVTKVLRKVGFAEVVESKEGSSSQEGASEKVEQTEESETPEDTEDFGEKSEDTENSDSNEDSEDTQEDKQEDTQEE